MHPRDGLGLLETDPSVFEEELYREQARHLAMVRLIITRRLATKMAMALSPGAPGPLHRAAPVEG